MAALDLISEVATDAPLQLVADDAQWLDRPTSEVLAFIARRIESDPIILLVATRDGYPSVLEDAGLPEHRLTTLDDAAAAELLDLSAPSFRSRRAAESCAKRPGTPSRCWSCPLSFVSTRRRRGHQVRCR